jgi:RHS repeat-associated protein
MELKDHLGNVSTVLTDRKKATPAVDELPRTYDADVLSYADYYPFGMEIAHRTESKEHEIDYQYGYVEVTDFDNPIYKRQLISDDGGVGDPYTFDHHFGTHATWTVGPNGVYNKYNPLGWGYMLNPSIDPDYISHCYFARGAYPSEPFLIQGSRDPNNNDNDCCNLSYASSSTVVPPHIVVESNSDPAETSLKFTGYTANPIVSLLFFNRVRGMIKLGKNYELGGVNMPSNLRGKGIPEGAYETDISFSIASYDIKPGSLKIYVTDAQGNHYVDPAIISVIENNQTSYNEGDIWHAVNMSVHLLNVDPDLGYRLVIEFDPQNNFSFYPSYVKIKQLKYDIKLFEGYGTKIVNRGTYQTAENTGYRYGFNGMEKDDEWKGAGNSLDFGARIQDPRLGRFLSIDPMASSFPGESNYIQSGNNPIYYIDIDGKFKWSPWAFENRPALKNYVENHFYNDVKNSSSVLSNLMKFGQFKTKEDALKGIKHNEGPYIYMSKDPCNGAFMMGGGFAGGCYSPSDPEVLEINVALFDQMEKILSDPNMSEEDKQAAMLAVFATILHEYAEYGDVQADGKSNGDNYEEGDTGEAFENATYGTDMGYNRGNASQNAEDYMKVAKEVVKEKSETEEGKKDLPSVN